MRTPVEIGIVGTGSRLVRLARAFEEVPSASLRWVCDPTAETRLGPIPHRRERVRTTLRLDDLLLDEALDAIVVATPVPTHYELAWAALAADKHVLIDAPATETSEQSDTLADVAADRARRLTVVQPLLFHPGMQKLKELIDLGRLGELYYLCVDWSSGTAEPPTGGVWTLCAEPLAVLPYLLDDEPVEVAARAESYAEPDLVELLVCHFRFATGITVQLRASILEPRTCARLAVVGSRRMAVFDELETERKLTVYDRPGGVRGRAGRVGEIVCPQLRDGEPLVLALEHFVDRVRERGPDVTSQAPGVAAVHLIEALQESIVRGGATVPIHRNGVQTVAAPVIQLPLRRD
jgi:predicted dehydrogenase